MCWNCKEEFSKRVRNDQKTWEFAMPPYNFFEPQFPHLGGRYNDP